LFLHIDVVDHIVVDHIEQEILAVDSIGADKVVVGSMLADILEVERIGLASASRVVLLLEFLSLVVLLLGILSWVALLLEILFSS
jgi:hypothetical protein